MKVISIIPIYKEPKDMPHCPICDSHVNCKDKAVPITAYPMVALAHYKCAEDLIKKRLANIVDIPGFGE